MGSAFEFLFCPIHGLVRPENLIVAWAGLNNVLLQAGYYLRKAGIL